MPLDNDQLQVVEKALQAGTDIQDILKDVWES